MDILSIYTSFQALNTSAEKVEYLKQLEQLNLPYDINYTNLINYWSTH
jgi:hypothetical protein